MKPSRLYLVLIFLSLAANVSGNQVSFVKNSASATRDDSYPLQSIPSEFHFSFDSVSMPDHNEKNMGLLGGAYRIHFLPWAYGGISGFGAGTGDRGGLFVLGVTAGLQQRLFYSIWGDAGIDAGGGGGRTADVGSGLMLRPHAGLAYDFGLFRLGITYSKVRFTDGRINNNQVGVSLDIPDALNYASPAYRGKTLNDLCDLCTQPGKWIHFDNFFFAPMLKYYFPSNNTKDLSGNIHDATVGLVGIEAGYFLNHSNAPSRTFIFANTSGAYQGQYNGYMEVFGGLGYRYPLWQQLFLTGRLAAGAGGGGQVNTGGGFLAEPSLALGWQFTSHLSTELAGGYITAPNGNFHAPTADLKLVYSAWTAKMGNSSPAHNAFTPSSLTFHGWRVRLTDLYYQKTQRKEGSKRPINLIEVKIDALVTSNFYVTGQAGSAYSGSAGGYSTGMFGAGLTKKFWKDRFEGGIELAAGAGGGGGLDVGGGLLLQPTASIGYYFTQYISAEASVGYVYAPRGNLKSPIADLGVAWHFSTLDDR